MVFPAVKRYCNKMKAANYIGISILFVVVISAFLLTQFSDSFQLSFESVLRQNEENLSNEMNSDIEGLKHDLYQLKNDVLSAINSLPKPAEPKVPQETHESKGVKEVLAIPPEFEANAKAQAGQDIYMYKTYFKDIKDGIFIEFGGRDGIEHSNSYFFEKNMNWKGLMVEAFKEEYDGLKVNRPNSITVHGAVCAEEGSIELVVSEFVGWHGALSTYAKSRLGHQEKTITVPCFTLDYLLETSGFKHVDYFTIDTEGSELEILKSLDFSKYVIDFVQVESLIENEEMRKELLELMKKNGYEVVNVFDVGSDTYDYLFKRTQGADLLKFEAAKAKFLEK